MERTDQQIWRAEDVARLLALSETEKRLYQRILSVVPVGLAVVSSGGEIVAVNRAFRHLFQLRGDEASRKAIDQLLPTQAFLQRLTDAYLGVAAPDPVVVERLNRRLETRLFPLFPGEEPGSGKVLVMVREAEREGLRERTPVAETPLAEGPAAAGAGEIAEVAEVAGAVAEAAPAAESRVEAAEAVAEEIAPEPAVSVPPVVETTRPPAAPEPQKAEPAAAAGFENAPAVLWTARRDTREFLAVAGPAQALFGAPNGAWLGDPRFFGARIANQDRARVLEFYTRCFGEPGEYACEFRAPNGRWIRETVRVSATTATGVATDITERRRLEAQSFQAQRVEAAAQFSGRLAHDLNNPLMIITGYGEELFSSLMPDHPMRRDLEEIVIAAERMTKTTALLTAFSRPQLAGAAPVELGELLAAHGTALAKAAQAPVEIAPPAAPCWGFAHPDTLVKALSALLGGAKDRTRARVTLTTQEIREELGDAALKPGRYAAIRIAVEGPQTAPPAFEACLASRDISQAYLAVRSWGGDITAEPGAFVVTLRAAEPPAPTEEIPQPALEPEPEPPPRRGTVLLVEDEGGIRALVRKILKREGYQVLESSTGEEAVRTALSHIGRIDLLLSDMTLPGMSGRQVADQLRQTMPHLRALFISGFSEDRSLYEAELPEGTGFLQKPFTLGALLSKVRGVIEGS